jgi:hypothetical protein
MLHQLDDLGEYGHMCAAEYADADGIHVFLESGVDDHLRGLAQSGVNDFHAGIPQGGGDDPGSPVVSVQSHFGDQYTDGSAGASRLIMGMSCGVIGCISGHAMLGYVAQM